MPLALGAVVMRDSNRPASATTEGEDIVRPEAASSFAPVMSTTGTPAVVATKVVCPLPAPTKLTNPKPWPGNTDTPCANPVPLCDVVPTTVRLLGFVAVMVPVNVDGEIDTAVIAILVALKAPLCNEVPEIFSRPLVVGMRPDVIVTVYTAVDELVADTAVTVRSAEGVRLTVLTL